MSDFTLRPRSLRVARPVRNLEATRHFYESVPGLAYLGGFEDHDTYNGIFIGVADSDWHLEFTHHRSELPVPSPTPEDLLVFYVSLDQIARVLENARAVGSTIGELENPYWATVGAVSLVDPDGYLIVLSPERAAS